MPREEDMAGEANKDVLRDLKSLRRDLAELAFRHGDIVRGMNIPRLLCTGGTFHYIESPERTREGGSLSRGFRAFYDRTKAIGHMGQHVLIPYLPDVAPSVKLRVYRDLMVMAEGDIASGTPDSNVNTLEASTFLSYILLMHDLKGHERGFDRENHDQLCAWLPQNAKHGVAEYAWKVAEKGQGWAPLLTLCATYKDRFTNFGTHPEIRKIALHLLNNFDHGFAFVKLVQTLVCQRPQTRSLGYPYGEGTYYSEEDARPWFEAVRRLITALQTTKNHGLRLKLLLPLLTMTGFLNELEEGNRLTELRSGVREEIEAVFDLLGGHDVPRWGLPGGHKFPGDLITAMGLKELARQYKRKADGRAMETYYDKLIPFLEQHLGVLGGLDLAESEDFDTVANICSVAGQNWVQGIPQRLKYSGKAESFRKRAAELRAEEEARLKKQKSS